MKLLAIVVPFIVYFLGGWIVKDIYFSIYPITGDTTIQYISSRELMIYAFIASAYNALIIIMNDLDDNITMCSIVFLVPLASAVLVSFLPLSFGALILNTILCVGTMIFTGIFAVDD